jgi:hypothetical protein
MGSWDISFLFPRRVVSAIAGLEEAEEPSGEKVLRLIQIFFLMGGVFYGTCPNLSSQASPNFHVHASPDTRRIQNPNLAGAKARTVLCIVDCLLFI